MRKYLLAFTSMLLFFAGGYEGCEEEKQQKEYIVVTTNAVGDILVYDLQGNVITCETIAPLLSGLQIRLEIVKAGGESCVYYDPASGCITGEYNCTLNLYREQPIVVAAILQGGVEGYSVTNGEETLTWEEAVEGESEGKYFWEAFPTIVLRKQ